MTGNSIEKSTISIADLEFREITREVEPSIKEKLIEKEAVHPFSGVDDLTTHRMAPQQAPEKGGVWDKRCFGLFAPGSDTPEAAVYVKLLHLDPDAKGQVASIELPGDIHSILTTPVAPVEKPNTAIFYTITNMGLTKEGRPDPNHPIKVAREEGGDTVAERLIKKVAEHLGKDENGAIKNFSTLSPLRRGVGDSAKGFAQWLDAKLESGVIDGLLTPIEKETLGASPAYAIGSMRYGYEQLAETQKKFFNTLMKDLGVYYLAEEKSPNVETIVRDPVGQFHLSNGAQIANIHYRHDATTESDQKGGGGLMVNYRYELDKIAERKHAYKESGAVAVDPEMAERHTQRLDGLENPNKSVIVDDLQRDDTIQQPPTVKAQGPGTP